MRKDDRGLARIIPPLPVRRGPYNQNHTHCRFQDDVLDVKFP